MITLLAMNIAHHMFMATVAIQFCPAVQRVGSAMSVATTLKLPSAHPAAAALPAALCSPTLATTDRNRPAISPTGIAGVLRSCVVAAVAPLP